jgi:4-cresol dehydrogenase (hydroxylating) flavoprotein subunit
MTTRTEENTAAGTPSGPRAALELAARVVGADRVSRPEEGDTFTLGPNTSLFRSRAVHGVIRPRTAEEVREVVRIYGSSREAGSLHAFSTGRNWGLGSREPARDGATVLDLRGLDRVRELDVSGGWAVVEPGVTQARLAGLLDGTERMLNVTVSTAHSSVIGNTVDRGVGLRSQRVEDLLGLEVVLPDGQVLHVGWWPDPEQATPVYPYGLGPSLLQTFVQSDYGIVTAAVVRLLPRPEALRVVRLNFTPDRLPEAIDEVRRWVAQGLARGVVKIYNPAAARAYQGAEDAFLVHVPVDGSPAVVDALTTIVTEEARRSGLFRDIAHDDAQNPAADNHDMAKLVERSYLGDPDVTDTLFRAKMGRPAEEIDEQVGFLFFLPLVPFTGEAIARADKILEQVTAETGLRCGATLNSLSADVIDFVVTMKFERTEELAARGHRALDLLHELFAEAGFVPYRLDVEHVEWADRFIRDAPSRALVRRIKDLIDPNQAIAPGRYA